MLFCDIDLAARIERAERRLVEAACDHVRHRLPDLYAVEVGGGLAAITEPGSPLNKVAGLGFAPFDEAAWLTVEAEHARRRTPVQVEIATLADPAVAKWLTGRGYELVGVENVLGRALSATDAFPTDPEVAIAASGAAELGAWLDVTITGFGIPDAQGVAAHEQFDRTVLERIIRDFAQAEGFVRYLARRGGEPAGAATMRMADGIAQLCGAATLPAHRRRGVQSALLAHRLGAAARGGCSLVVVTTQPGSKSQQNVMRLGFQLLYSRNVLRRFPERSS